MERRNFIKNSSLLAASIGVFGKIQWNGTNYTGDSPTTTDILGPFYRPGSPMRSNIIPPGSAGEILHLSGTVFKKDGTTPLKDALIEVWQVNEKAVYDNISDEYLGRGAVKTGKDGKYYFKTIMPVAYQIGENRYRPAHIHFRISGTDHQDLITQIYFKGDPHLAEDSSSSSPLSINRILSVTENANKEKAVQFDIVMREEYPLDIAVFNKVCGLYQMNDKSMAEFFKKGDLLFVKINGQIEEGLSYKGNNIFEGGLAWLTVEFEILASGGVKAKATYFDDDNKQVKIEGTKFLKYSE